MMTGYDASGIERVSFDGRPLTLPAHSRRRPSPRHGPTCQPSNPEVGCECGYAEWRDEQDEMRWLRQALATAPDARDADQQAAVAYYLAHSHEED